MEKWLTLHPKVKALAYAVGILVLGSIPAVLNNTVTLKDAAVADVTAIIALVIVYLKGSGNA